MKSRQSVLLDAAALLGLSAVFAVAVGAETTPSAAGADSGGTAELEAVIVTAQRRSENLQDVPISVEAFNATALDAAVITTTADLDIITPGLETGSESGYAQPHLRGVGTIATNPGIENPVALYVDGVYYGALAGGVLSLNNVAQIEVDKGPQGTLFGRNATGGLIQITTKDPSQSFEGQAGLSYGNYNTSGANLYVSGGLAPTIAADFAGYLSNQGTGYGVNYFTGQQVNKTMDAALRSKWIFDPSDSTQVKVIVDYEKTHFSPVYLPAPGTTPLGGPPYTGNPQSMDGYYQPYGFLQQGGVSVQIRQNLEFGTFTSITAYRRLWLQTVFDGGLVTDFDYALNINIIEPHAQYSQEFQLASPVDSRLKWVTGMYLYNSDAKYNPISIYGGLLAPLSLDNTDSDQKDYSAALYAQATGEVAADTNLTLGLRYTYEHRNFEGSNILVAPGSPPFVAATDEANVSYEKPTWRIALDHKFAPQYMAYISYNRGFKSGGFNDDMVPTTQFKPETLDAFELGLKSDFFANRVRVNTAGFYYNYTNIQAVRYPNGLEEVYNAPKARIYGLDLDTVFAVTQQLEIRAGVEALHTEYVNFPDADYTTPAVGGGTNFGVFNAAGNRLSLAPDFTGDITASYTVPTRVGKASFNVTYAYNSGWYAEPDNRLHQGAYSLVNAQIAFTPVNSLWDFKLWGKNLTNTQYTSELASQENGDYAIFAPPRTYGGTIERRF
jgi:iron complex outermembrane receptor protein